MIDGPAIVRIREGAQRAALRRARTYRIEPQTVETLCHAVEGLTTQLQQARADHRDRERDAEATVVTLRIELRTVVSWLRNVSAQVMLRPPWWWFRARRQWHHDLIEIIEEIEPVRDHADRVLETYRETLGDVAVERHDAGP